MLIKFSDNELKWLEHIAKKEKSDTNCFQLVRMQCST